MKIHIDGSKEEFSVMPIHPDAGRDELYNEMDEEDVFDLAIECLVCYVHRSGVSESSLLAHKAALELRTYSKAYLALKKGINAALGKKAAAEESESPAPPAEE